MNLTINQKNFIEKYDFKNNIIFIGDVGVGKTYEAHNLYRKFEGKKYSIEDAEFKKHIQSGNIRFKKPDEWKSNNELFPLEMMLKCPLLFYDDLGVSNITDAYIRDFQLILDTRKRKKLVTIFTTNLTPIELEKHLGKRIKSRIFHNNNVIEITGKDLRRNNINIIK